MYDRVLVSARSFEPRFALYHEFPLSPNFYDSREPFHFSNPVSMGPFAGNPFGLCLLYYCSKDPKDHGMFTQRLMSGLSAFLLCHILSYVYCVMPCVLSHSGIIHRRLHLLASFLPPFTG